MKLISTITTRIMNVCSMMNRWASAAPVQSWVALGSLIFAVGVYLESRIDSAKQDKIIEELQNELSSAHRVISDSHNVLSELARSTQSVRSHEAERLQRSSWTLAHIEELPSVVDDDIFSNFRFENDGFQYSVAKAVAYGHNKFVVTLYKLHEEGLGFYGTGGDTMLLATIEGDEFFLHPNKFITTSYWESLRVVGNEIVISSHHAGLTWASFPRQEWICDYTFDPINRVLDFYGVRVFEVSHLLSGPCHIMSENAADESIMLTDFVYSEVADHYLSDVRWSEELGGYID